MEKQKKAEWHSFWSDFDLAKTIYPLESDDYVQRLVRVVPISLDSRILDFGCGFGYVTNSLASKVKKITIWDYSQKMRLAAAKINSKHSNVMCLDMANPEEVVPDFPVDIILVNSVIQYMTLDELEKWLQKWKKMYKKNGKLIISDILDLESNPIKDFWDLFCFCLRKGILFRALYDELNVLRAYSSTRINQPLLKLSKKDLKRIAGNAGYRPILLKENLTYRKNRYSALLDLE